MNPANAIDPIFTVRQFSERHPAFSQASLRNLLFKAHQNGMARHGVIVRVGRRILLSEPRFLQWLSVTQEGNR